VRVAGAIWVATFGVVQACGRFEAAPVGNDADAGGADAANDAEVPRDAHVDGAGGSSGSPKVPCPNAPGGFTESFGDTSWYKNWTRFPNGTVVIDTSSFASGPGSLSVALSADPYTELKAGLERTLAGKPCNSAHLKFTMRIDAQATG
jgi:hypothetical protein